MNIQAVCSYQDVVAKITPGALPDTGHLQIFNLGFLLLKWMNFNLGMNNKDYKHYIVWDEIKYLYVSQQGGKHRLQGPVSTCLSLISCYWN